ncbi:MAG: hypothetical protein U5L72_08055 [Bacteroidales bacterium]|nr:hypothetical protein [Bacteroidales bacterium]
MTACGNSSGGVGAIAQAAQQPVDAPVMTASLTSQVAEATNINATSVANIISSAKAEGKAVFLVLTGNGSPDTDKAMLIANGARNIYKNAVVVQMNKDDATNSSLVAEYRLAGAPVPLILVISAKGMPTGGVLLAQATAENLAALIPSPRLEEIYDAIANKKIALVVFSRKAFTDKAEVMKECKSAVSKLNSNAVIVEVDMDDTREANFMNQLRIDKNQLNGSLTLVINTQGQVAGTSTTVPDAAKLALAATTPVQGGCGPGLRAPGMCEIEKINLRI